jgi:Zn-dependent protease with chaperone function
VAAAVALLVGFYVFALVVALGLLALAVVPWMTDLPQNVWLTVACGIAGVTILGAIRPRRLPFEAPGPELSEVEQPELFALVREVAHETGQEMPQTVYLAHDFNAAVAQAGGFLGVGGHRVLIVGLPLLQGLTRAQPRAVLAHEFGHYAGGDVRLGPFFGRTYDAVARTVSALHEAESWWHKPFELYGLFFLRRSASIKRAQEFEADREAARVAGRDVNIAALHAVHAQGAAFEAYFHSEYVPLLERGRCAPYLGGFDLLKRTSAGEQVMSAAVEHASGEPDPYATHPELPERLAALQSLPDDGRTDDGEPALALLREIRSLESAVLRWLVPQAELEALRWEDVPEQVFVPGWQRAAAAANGALDGVTVAQIPGAIDRSDRIGRALMPEEDVWRATPEMLKRIGADAIGARLALALRDSGWRLTAPPGEPVAFDRDGARIEPFAEVDRILAGELSADAWRERAGSLGIDALNLGAPAAGPAPAPAPAPLAAAG